ncbi:hypothetical protein KY285_019457 [Solanum tuberosum]|nr:hypothetical protein KY285_019457 [Solanum tuberosum]
MGNRRKAARTQAVHCVLCRLLQRLSQTVPVAAGTLENLGFKIWSWNYFERNIISEKSARNSWLVVRVSEVVSGRIAARLLVLSHFADQKEVVSCAPFMC